jgi:hypothetical protein
MNTDIHNLHNSQVKQLITYFYTKRNNSHLLQIICDTDVNYRHLSLYDPFPQQNENTSTIQERITTWKNNCIRKTRL